MALEEDNNKTEDKGFAGLSSLVSNVDMTPPAAARPQATATGGRTAQPAACPGQAPSAPSQRRTQHDAMQSRAGRSSGGKWLLGMAAAVAVLWLIGYANRADRTSSTPLNASPTQNSPPAQPQVASAPQESKPPIGADLVLSSEEIQYCLAEDIRMDGAKSVLDHGSDNDVDRFNALVADYNSRCGSFRYRIGALDDARRAIEPYRSQLQSEGRKRFAHPGTDPLSDTAP